MRSERGQASVEWIGTVLLVALALAALTCLAPDAGERDLGTTLLASVIPTAPHAQVVGMRSGKRNDSPPPGERSFTAPPLVPRSGDIGRPPSMRTPGGLRLGPAGLPLPPAGLRFPPGAERLVLDRVRRGAGLAWRRAWLACLAYERFRYGFLHPNSRFRGYTIPPAELLRIGNDCISPVDLVRDWPLLRGR